MTKGMKKRSLARMRAWQKEEKKWSYSGAKLRRNIFNNSVLWSQTPDTEWYWRYRDNVPKGYIRLVATWPDSEEGEIDLFEPELTLGTLTGWGTEAYFALDHGGDRTLTEQERLAVADAMAEVTK